MTPSILGDPDTQQGDTGAADTGSGTGGGDATDGDTAGDGDTEDSDTEDAEEADTRDVDQDVDQDVDDIDPDTVSDVEDDDTVDGSGDADASDTEPLECDEGQVPEDGVCVVDCPPWATRNGDECDDPPHELYCDDGHDNDNDGLTDCADPDCYGDSACADIVYGDSCGFPMELIVGEQFGLNTCDMAFKVPVMRDAGCGETRDVQGDALFRFTAPSAGSWLIYSHSVWHEFTHTSNLLLGEECPVDRAARVCESSFYNTSSLNARPHRIDLDQGETVWLVVGSVFDFECGQVTAWAELAEPEICDDGIDNDGNELVDCADPACEDSAACLLEQPGDTCRTALELHVGTPLQVDTSTMNSDYSIVEQNGCRGVTSSSKDAVLFFTAPVDGDYLFETESRWATFGHTVNAVRSAPCPESSEVLECAASTRNSSSQDKSEMTVSMVAGETIWLILGSAYFADSGIATIQVARLLD